MTFKFMIVFTKDVTLWCDMLLIYSLNFNNLGKSDLRCVHMCPNNKDILMTGNKQYFIAICTL